MFFIIGINQKQKVLDFHQMTICKCCDKYTQIEVVMVYTYLMLFFIPIMKWNKHYYVRMRCCGASSEIDTEIGRDIEKGIDVQIDIESLDFNCQANSHSTKICENCGFSTDQHFKFCPNCGKPF